MKRGPEHFSPVKQDNRKKVYVENTAKIPVVGASNTSGAGWRDLMLQPPPLPPDKTPPLGSANPLTKEPDRRRRRSYDRDKDNSGTVRNQNPEDAKDEIHQEKKLTTLC